MNPSRPNRKRRTASPFAPELLETRQMLTGGVGSTFAIIPGHDLQGERPGLGLVQPQPGLLHRPGQQAVSARIWTSPRDEFDGQPVITSVVTPDGQGRCRSAHAAYDRPSSGPAWRPRTSSRPPCWSRSPA